MKKIFKYIALAAVASVSLMSCNKTFDNLEGDKSKIDSEAMFRSEAGIVRVLARLYAYMPMGAFSTADKDTFLANASRAAQSYSPSIAGFWSYSNIRSMNKFLVDIEEAQKNGVISEEYMKNLKGEVMFIRAYCYFASVRVYGGIPIVTEVLDDKYVPGTDNEGLYFPRLTEKESWDWVIKAFEDAAELLPEVSQQQMRVNKYTAYAMQARAALWAASESKYWDRASLNGNYKAVQEKLSYMEKSYADAYYQKAIDAATKVIESKKYKLYGYNGTPLSVAEATKTANDLFQDWRADEGILGRSYKTGLATDNNGVEPSQSWGTAHQVTSGYLGGAYSVTLNLVEEYDDYAADGSRKSGVLNTGSKDVYTNGAEKFDPSTLGEYKRYDNVTDIFANKDARFQAWIVYPGCNFRNTTIYMQGGMIMPTGVPNIYPTDNNGVEFQGKTYYPYGGQDEQNSAFYKLFTDKNGSNRTDYSFMVRKYMDQSNYNDANQTPWYDLRYAEVLLTYAEAVAESGKGDAKKAKDYLNDIRHRAGFTDNVEATVENILHEWKVEFAFEDKWQSVLTRRRAYYRGTAVYDGEGERKNKEIIVPLVDLSGDKAQYIYLRAVSYGGTPSSTWGPGNLTFDITSESYYHSIPNYVNNKLIDNNK